MGGTEKNSNSMSLSKKKLSSISETQEYKHFWNTLHSLGSWMLHPNEFFILWIVILLLLPSALHDLSIITEIGSYIHIYNHFIFLLPKEIYKLSWLISRTMNKSEYLEHIIYLVYNIGIGNSIWWKIN